MRTYFFTAVTAAALAVTAALPSSAHASWLSEALHNWFDPYDNAGAYYAPTQYYYTSPYYYDYGPAYSYYAPGYSYYYAAPYYYGPRYYRPGYFGRAYHYGWHRGYRGWHGGRGYVGHYGRRWH